MPASKLLWRDSHVVGCLDSHMVVRTLLHYFLCCSNFLIRRWLLLFVLYLLLTWYVYCVEYCQVDHQVATNWLVLLSVVFITVDYAIERHSVAAKERTQALGQDQRVFDVHASDTVVNSVFAEHVPTSIRHAVTLWRFGSFGLLCPTAQLATMSREPCSRHMDHIVVYSTVFYFFFTGRPEHAQTE